MLALALAEPSFDRVQTMHRIQSALLPSCRLSLAPAAAGLERLSISSFNVRADLDAFPKLKSLVGAAADCAADSGPSADISH